MSAGTLTLINNSAAVGGSGTSFTTDLAAGDFIVATVGGITYTLPVKSVESATSLTLISNYPGPTQSGVAWSAVPRAAQNQITAALVAQTTEALRGLNSDKQNWQAVFSDSGDITVILPDGSSFTGPSWKKISDLLADIDPAGLQQIADQVSADAQQVATDRQDVDTKASQVSGDVATATQAATDAAAANTTAQQAKTDAVAANTAAQQAKTDAQAAAASVNPDNLLQKANNLNDLADKSVAWTNLLTARTAITARADLGLGNAALLNTGFGVNGNVMLQGQYGLGTILSNTGQTAIPLLMSGLYGESSASGWKPQTAGSGVITGYDSVRRQMYFISANGSGFYVRSISEGEYNASASTYAWTQMQAVGTSDINLKNVLGDLDVNEALANINAMEFKRFTYKDDESAAERRGVIAQQVENIDPQYVHPAEGVGKMTLDLNPLLMDALAAIKALSAKVDVLNAEISELKGAGS